MKKRIIILLVLIAVIFVSFYIFRNKQPTSFRLEELKEVHYSQDITLHWQKSQSYKNIKYKILYGMDALLKDTSVIVIENITDTFCALTNLRKGEYYWRVFASDGKNEIVNDSTKNSFEIVPLEQLILTKDTYLLKKDSPHYIDKVWIIKKGVTLNIEAGCKLLLAEGVNIINYGNVFAKGTSKDSIWFVPQKYTWGEIYSHEHECNLEFDYCYFKDGLFRSTYANITFSNCRYIFHHKSLYQDGIRTAILWSYRGRFLMDSCYFENKLVTAGEGMTIEQAQTSITNSVFCRMADAVEFLNVRQGEIRGNIIIDSPDDAIDMNGCSNILIENNILANNNDKAVSVGTEQYGPSYNIRIKNNFMIKNNCGVSVKDSSFCTIENNSFVNNRVALDAHLKNNWKQYSLGGNTKVSHSLFYDNRNLFKLDSSSILQISYSLSNDEEIKGKGNRVEDIIFKDESLNNYNSQFSEGANISLRLINKYNELKR